jgi:hypothetical protein
MAAWQYGPLRSAPTTTDLSAKTGYAVVTDSSGNLVVVSTLQSVIDGVLVDDPKTGQNGTYQVRDVAKVIAGAAFAVGANLEVTAAGKFVTATTGKPIVAKALEAASGVDVAVTAEIGYRGPSA